MKALIFVNALFCSVAILMIVCRTVIPQRGEYEERVIGGIPLYLGKGALGHQASTDKDQYSFSSVYAGTVSRIFDVVAASASLTLALGCILLRNRTNNIRKRRLADAVTSNLFHVGVAHCLFFWGGHVVIVLSTSSLEIPVLYYLGIIVAGVDAAVTMDKFREYKESMIDKDPTSSKDNHHHHHFHQPSSSSSLSQSLTNDGKNDSSTGRSSAIRTWTEPKDTRITMESVSSESSPQFYQPALSSPTSSRSNEVNIFWPPFMAPRRLLSLSLGHTLLCLCLCIVRTFPVPEVNLPINLFCITWVLFAIYRAWDGGLYGPGENLKNIKHLNAVEQLTAARLNLLRGGYWAAIAMFLPMMVSLVAELLYAARILPYNIADVLIRQQLFLRAIEGGYILVTSITTNDEKAAYDAVKTKLQERIAQDAVRQALIRYLFHEVRVPLNSVYLGLKLMHDEHDTFTADQNRILAIMLAATQTAIGVMSDTLDLARLERGDAWIPQLSPAHVKSMMDDIISQNQPFAVGHGVVLECIIDNNVPEYVLCAKSQVQQILNNYLTNGIKFSSMVNRKVVRSTNGSLSASKRLALDDNTISGNVTIRVSTNPPDELFRTYEASKWHSSSKSIMHASANHDHGEKYSHDHQEDDKKSLSKSTQRFDFLLRSASSSLQSIWKRLHRENSVLSSTKSSESTASSAASTMDLRFVAPSNTSSSDPSVSVGSPESQTSFALQRSFGDKVQNTMAPPASIVTSPIATKPANKPAYEDSDSSYYSQGKPCTLYFTVIDNGCGIPADDIGHLFRAFQQLEAGSKYRGRGTGLGLAISRSVASILGGKVGLASTVGRGTVFALQLPLQPLRRVQLSLTPVENMNNFYPSLPPDHRMGSGADTISTPRGSNPTNRSSSPFAGYSPRPTMNSGSETSRSQNSVASNTSSKERMNNFIDTNANPSNESLTIGNNQNNLQQLLQQHRQYKDHQIQQNNQAVLDRLFKGKDDTNSTYARMALWAPTSDAIDPWWKQQQQQRSTYKQSFGDSASDLQTSDSDEHFSAQDTGQNRNNKVDKIPYKKRVMSDNLTQITIVPSLPGEVTESLNTVPAEATGVFDSTPENKDSNKSIDRTVNTTDGDSNSTLNHPLRMVRGATGTHDPASPASLVSSRPPRPIKLEPTVPVSTSTKLGENIAVRYFVVDDVLSNREFLARLLRRRCGTSCKVFELNDGEQILEVIQKYMDEETNTVNNNSSHDTDKKGGEDMASLPTIVESPTVSTPTSLSDTVATKLSLRYVNVICMDGDMPVVDGYKATEILRTTMQFKGLIIGCTGNALAEDQVRFLDAGADMVLCKPIDPLAILNKTKEWVETIQKMNASSNYGSAVKKNESKAE